METLQPPQLVVNSRMLYFGWVPADPKAAEEFVPTGLKPLPNRQVLGHVVIAKLGKWLAKSWWEFCLYLTSIYGGCANGVARAA